MFVMEFRNLIVLLNGGNLTNGSLIGQAITFSAPKDGYGICQVTAAYVMANSRDVLFECNCVYRLAFVRF